MHVLVFSIDAEDDHEKRDQPHRIDVGLEFVTWSDAQEEEAFYCKQPERNSKRSEQSLVRVPPESMKEHADRPAAQQNRTVHRLGHIEVPVRMRP
jgi:hypothetical protein